MFKETKIEPLHQHLLYSSSWYKGTVHLNRQKRYPICYPEATMGYGLTITHCITWSQRAELNCRPTDYETVSLHLLTVIFIRLAVTLVACCATKCQEKPIRLTQIW